MTDRGARRRAEIRLVEATERPELVAGEHWPEDDRRPWEGRTERGRAAMRRARARLDAAEAWQPGADGARMGDTETSQEDTSGH